MSVFRSSIFHSRSSPSSRQPRRNRVARWIFVLVVVALLLVGASAWWSYHGPTPPTEIYQGVVYSCERMPNGPESGGLLHLIRADLNVPGVSLYITPLDPQAVARGQQYRLRYVSTAVRADHLAAAVNGTLFFSESTLIRIPGDWARSNETVVANHVVSHVHRDTYLLWWDDRMMAHLEITKPPSPADLARAKWAIGGQMALLMNGKINPWAGHAADHRTMIAADPEKRLVWLAVFDKASYTFAAETLARHGAKIGTMVDGGTSSAMAIGVEARGVRSGTVTGNWRPVATQFGVRALPMPRASVLGSQSKTQG